MSRYFTVPLAASVMLAASAGSALAVTAYDARTLGMGGSSIGYSGNASLAYWNPAAVGMNRNWGVYLPSVGFSLSNNLLSPGEASSLFGQLFANPSTDQAAASSTALNSSLTSIFTKLGSSGGLNIQAETIVEPLGLDLGKIGPGSLAVRVYGHALASGRIAIGPATFTDNLTSLFFQGGFTDILTAVTTLQSDSKTINAGTQAQLKKDADSLQAKISSNMSSFLLKNGATKGTTKSFSVDETAGVDATAAFTYAQILPIKIPALPKAQISVGTTAKIFGSPGSTLAGISQLPLPGGPTGNEKLSPLGGGAGASINLNVDKQVTDLVNSIDALDKDTNFATISDVAAKSAAFFNDGLSASNLQFTSTTPDNVGFGLDLGGEMKIDDNWSVGLSLINPLLLWGATQTTYTYKFADTISLVPSAAKRVSFSAAEPFVARAGVAYQPVFLGAPPALAKGLLINLGTEAPFGSGISPSVQLGVEKTFFDAFAIRLGTSQFGLTPLYTAGLGVQTKVFQMNLGVGVDNPSASIKAVAAAFTIGAGF